MSIFDQLRSAVSAPAPTASAEAPDRKQATFTFAALPESLAEMQALPEAALTDPFQTAALTVCALCAYAADKTVGLEMLNWLRGPRPMGGHETAFLDERFRDKLTYIPFSYFKGAAPENDYTPATPFTLTVETNLYSDANEGYKKLFIRSGGADHPREVVLRKKADGTWLLWDQALMVTIREPKSADPWA